MKKVLIAAIFFIFMSGSVFADAYAILGVLYDADGTSGNASTANSFATFCSYRTGIPGQIGCYINNEDGTIDDATGTYPASLVTDVGSTDWAATPPAAEQEVKGVFEVDSDKNGWTGDAYFAFTEKTISAQDILNVGTVLSLSRLVKVNAPEILQDGDTSITVGWTGADIEGLIGYSLYRKTEPSGTYTLLTQSAQDEGNLISYTDDFGMDITGSYTYKLALLFEWGGGNGAPDYYETTAMSAASAEAGYIVPVNQPTPVPHELARNLAKEKVIVFNNPIRDNKFMVGFDSSGIGTAYIYIYNLAGQTVRKIVIPCVAGANIYEDTVNMLAPGIYISKVVIQAGGDTIRHPAKKIAIIK